VGLNETNILFEGKLSIFRLQPGLRFWQYFKVQTLKIYQSFKGCETEDSTTGQHAVKLLNRLYVLRK